MSVFDFFLLSIGFGSLWWGIHDADEIHRLAAMFIGFLTLIWIFCLMPMLIKTLVLSVFLLYFFLV